MYLPLTRAASYLVLKIMDVPEDIPYISLEQCTYRHLQKLAKSMNLPSNVKKVYLIEMIYAKKHHSKKHLDSIVARIKEERKQTTKPRKAFIRKKKQLQGTETSSKSNHSSPICLTQTPHSPGRITKRYVSIPNPLMRRGIESDRVLRSYSKLRPNTKYSIMNNNTIVGIVKACNSANQNTMENQYEWNVELQKYRPVRIADCVIQRQQSTSTDYMLPLPRSINHAMQRQGEHFGSEERQVVPVGRSSNVAAIRERRLSGIYPLEPMRSYYQPFPGVGFRGQDGQISKINAVVQRSIETETHPELMLKNKITQTTVQRRLVQKPVVVSLRSLIRPKFTVQNVISCTIDGNFSGSSTESATECSADREIVPKMITSKCFQASFENMAFNKRDRQMLNEDSAIETTNRQAERNRSVEISKRYRDKMYAIINQRRTNNEMHATENQTSTDKMYATDNPTRCTDNNVVTENQNNMNVVIGTQNANRSDREYQENQSNIQDLNTYAVKHRNIYDAMYAKNSNKVNTSDYFTYTYAKQDDNRTNNAIESVNCTVEQSDNTDVKVYTENMNKIYDDPTMREKKFENSTIAMDCNNTTESINYSGNSSENEVDMIQNPGAEVMDRNERDYPNMSALTDMYPGDRAELISEANGNSSVFYHKKTLMEQAGYQSQPATSEPRAAMNSLPHISEVFNQFSEARYKPLTQTLHIDVGDAVKSSVKGPLESIYNYNAPDLEQPLNFHHLIVTTSTKCVYTTNTVTTAMAHTSSPGHWQYDNTVPRDRQRHTMEPHGPHDYLGDEDEPMREDITYDEVVQEAPASSLSTMVYELTAKDNSVQHTGANFEEALELISQDGDYMERIGMEARMQCILCDWAGPKNILEYHVGLEHPSDIVPRATSSWSTAVALGSARRGLRELNNCAGRVYVLSAACVGAGYFRIDLTILPKDYTEYFPKYGRLTVYNKMTGEPHIWEGPIVDLSESTEEHKTKSLYLDLASLDLLPNSANLKLVNGEWEVNSTENMVLDQLELDNIEIVVHVQIYD